ncbi:tetratricopeptide repeat protein [Halopseudomonas aestusnigri]|uniref:tetratricopeptide repeat protein n=1 Tax=Halopseudomonas aestusnigri TaxID=857252 RepID=UPI002556BD90|nr:tetratricopeptide repeat protein [Halopseudomonas aestusnigri]MDL2197681.1 tetratricopeptide repeat protein [Halopseudomonas aestusnigri]
MRAPIALLLGLSIALSGCQNLSEPDSLLSRSGEIIRTQSQRLADLASRLTSDPAARQRHADVEALFAQPYIDPLTRYLNAHANDPVYSDYIPLVEEERDSRCEAIGQRYAAEQPTRDNLRRLRAGYQFSCPNQVDAFAARVPQPASTPSRSSPTTDQQETCYLLFAIRNYSQAGNACRAAAEAGDAKAQHHLASIADSTGQGDTALRWARDSAEQGNTAGQLLLADLLQRQNSSEADRDAFSWLKKAADSGQPEARYQLALAYLNGTGTAVSPGKAEEQLRRAALAEHIPSILQLARNHPDTASARRWLTEAAELGSAEAQYRLGLDYMQGNGGPQDLEQAYFWLSLALVNGESRGRRYVEQLSGQLSNDQLTSARSALQQRINSR